MAADDTGVVWHYVYDNNGNRLQQIPGGLTPTENAVQYSYDQSNRLTQVESHDGNSFQLQAEMVYDGRGHRLRAVAYAEGSVFTATYAVDPQSGLPLMVDNGLETTLVLYGQVAIGEYVPQTAEWTYYLGDAQLSVRQLVDAAGTVTKVQTYGPYGHCSGVVFDQRKTSPRCGAASRRAAYLNHRLPGHASQNHIRLFHLATQPIRRR